VPGRGEETKRVRELRSLDNPFDALAVLFLLIMLFSPDLCSSLFCFLDLNMVRWWCGVTISNVQSIC